MNKTLTAHTLALLKPIADQERREYEESERAFREDGIISRRHFILARNRVLNYFLQKERPFLASDLRLIILHRDELDSFFKGIEWANGGGKEVARLLKLYDDEMESWPLKTPEDWSMKRPALELMVRDYDKFEREFQEDGILHHHHFIEARDRVLDYAVQNGRTFRSQDLHLLILHRDDLNRFIMSVEEESGGCEKVEELIQIYEDGGENSPLEFSRYWNW